MTTLLALGLLLLAGTAAPESIRRSTDQQGTIHIDNRSPAKPETAGEVKAPPAGQEKAPDQQGRAGEVCGPASQPALGMLHRHSRRTRPGLEGEVIPGPRNPVLAPAPSPAPPSPRQEPRDSGLLRPGRNAPPHSRTAIGGKGTPARRPWPRLAAAGNKNFTFHDLRHTLSITGGCRAMITSV